MTKKKEIYSATENLLRSVSKLFYKDLKWDPLYVPIYLKDKGINTIPVISFRGNRINTLFHNAAGTYYLRDILIQYFTTSKCSLNYTDKIILSALKDENIMAICRALGIICKVITQPYWNEAVGENRNALQMQPIYESLAQLLETASANPNFLLQNSIHLLPGPVSPPDLVTQSFFSSTSTDTVTQSLLKRFCTKLREKCSALFKDFPPSGKYFEPTQTLIESSETCPSNNISVERVFGKLDSELHRAPHCSLRTIESKIYIQITVQHHG
jgi:hypothetical protein